MPHHNVLADDMLVAVQADLHGHQRRVGRGVSIGQGIARYDTPAAATTLRPRRCAYPRCSSEATVRCAGCRRIYCGAHCQGAFVWSSDARPECTLCAGRLPRDSVAPQFHYSPLFAAVAVSLFLLAISLGVAIDMAARAEGRVALWVFGGAFLIFAYQMGRA